MPRKQLTEEGVAKLKAPVQGKQVDYYDTGQPGLVLRVNYGGKKTWRALYYVSTTAKSGNKAGQQIKMPTTHKLGLYPTLKVKEAREKARQFLTDPQKALAQADTDSFKQVAENFITRHVEANKDRKVPLRTKDDIVRLLTKHVYPKWGQKPFRDIKRSDVADLLDKIEDNNGPRQADVVLAIIRKMMNWFAARNDNYVSPVVKGMHRYNGGDHKRKRFLSDDEIRAFWKASGKVHPVYGALVKEALLTAQRQDKVSTMQHDEVVDGVWTIASEAREKSNARGLRLPQLARDIIEAQAQVRIEGNPYVFPGNAKGRRRKPTKDKKPAGPPSFNSFSQRKAELDQLMLAELHKIAEQRNDHALLADVAKIRSLLKAMATAKGEAKDEIKLEIRQQWWVFHDLRRTAKTLMARAGVRRDVSERVLGHAIAGVEGTYDQHDYEAEKADALNRLAALLKTIINPPEGNVVTLQFAQAVHSS